MESVGSNHIPPRVNPVSDRIYRALRHRIRLLHRPDAATFHVLGATSNVYTVTLASTPRCTCPDRTVPCKHILFVLIRVLGVPLDDTCLRRRNIRPCFLYRLLSAPTRPDCLAGFALRQRFLQLLSASVSDAGDSVTSTSAGKMVEEEENETGEGAATCPICLDEINAVKVNGEEREKTAVLKCRVCKNKVHEECMGTWRRSRGRRPASCVVCRARWRSSRANYVISPNDDGNHGNCYLNLAPYIGQDEDVVGTSHWSCAG
ncbi:PREDICTED: mitogen-activated protein kinase kinase kinase 1 [Tarenaya hassleriana]|uniref:mitogen-activated protein kinase kinase kinase 1 n=1 Tax=Tarenaya hassleriana TaxID=28532 RepID=UPI00053C5C00|nr:PREDICTED: mitogen-activated protein kinase kinase kinase 1 [Tarenaya hassleriana]